MATAAGQNTGHPARPKYEASCALCLQPGSLRISLQTINRAKIHWSLDLHWLAR